MASLNLPSPRFAAPFTFIDLAYTKSLEAIFDQTLGTVQAAVTTPLLACVTLWLVIQGVLVIRGDIDAQRAFGKMIKISIVVSLITSAELYGEYVRDLFVTGIPAWVQKMAIAAPFSSDYLPEKLDLVFNAGELLFIGVAKTVTMDNLQGTFAFEGAQFIFYLSLWSLFGVYDLMVVMTNLLVSIGPLFVAGFLFEATQDIAARWLGQLVNYAVLLLLINIVATIVVAIELGGLTVMAILIQARPSAAGIIGLYEIDMFLMTGNAIVVALPGLAAFLGGGLAAAAPRFVNSLYRSFVSNAPANERTVMNRFFMTGGLQ